MSSFMGENQFKQKITPEIKKFLYVSRTSDPPVTYESIRETINRDFGVDISTTTLSNHFKRFKKKLDESGERFPKDSIDITSNADYDANHTVPHVRFKGPGVPDEIGNFSENSAIDDNDTVSPSPNYEPPLDLEAILVTAGVKKGQRPVIMNMWNKDPAQSPSSLVEILHAAQVGYADQQKIIGQAYGPQAVRSLPSKFITQKNGQFTVNPSSELDRYLQNRIIKLRKRADYEELQEELDRLDQRRKKGDNLPDMLKDIFAIEAISKRNNPDPNPDNQFQSKIIEKLMDKQLNQENSIVKTLEAVKFLLPQQKEDSPMMKMLMDDRKMLNEQLNRVREDTRQSVEAVKTNNQELLIELLRKEAEMNRGMSSQEWQQHQQNMITFAESMGYKKDDPHAGTEMESRMKMFDKGLDILPNKIDQAAQRFETATDKALEKLSFFGSKFLDTLENQEIRRMQTMPQQALPHQVSPVYQQQPYTQQQTLDTLNRINQKSEYLAKLKKLQDSTKAV